MQMNLFLRQSRASSSSQAGSNGSWRPVYAGSRIFQEVRRSINLIRKPCAFSASPSRHHMPGAVQDEHWKDKVLFFECVMLRLNSLQCASSASIALQVLQWRHGRGPRSKSSDRMDGPCCTSHWRSGDRRSVRRLALSYFGFEQILLVQVGFHRPQSAFG